MSLIIKDDELVRGIKLCLSNTRDLLAASEKIVGEFEDDSISLGLYSYAIEEFGKALRFNDYRKRKKRSYTISKKIFENHNYKINRAKDELPKECISSESGIRVLIASPVTRTVELGDNARVSVPAMSTATVTDTTYGDVQIDFKFRKHVFFVSWNYNTESWQQKPRVVKDKMNEAISKFHAKIQEFEKTL